MTADVKTRRPDPPREQSRQRPNAFQRFSKKMQDAGRSLHFSVDTDLSPEQYFRMRTIRSLEEPLPWGEFLPCRTRVLGSHRRCVVTGRPRFALCCSSIRSTRPRSRRRTRSRCRKPDWSFDAVRCLRARSHHDRGRGQDLPLRRQSRTDLRGHSVCRRCPSRARRKHSQGT